MLDVSHRKADKVHRAVGRFKGIFKSNRKTSEEIIPRQRSLEDSIIFAENAARIAAKFQLHQPVETIILQKPRAFTATHSVVAKDKEKGRATDDVESHVLKQASLFQPGLSTIPHPQRVAPQIPQPQVPPQAPPTPEDSLVATPTTSHDIAREEGTLKGITVKAVPLNRNPYSVENYPKYTSDQRIENG